MDQMVQIVVPLDCIAVIIWVLDETNAVNNVDNAMWSQGVCRDRSLIILSTITVDFNVLIAI